MLPGGRPVLRRSGAGDFEHLISAASDESEKGYQDAHTKKWIDQQKLSERRNRIEIDKNLLRKMEIKDFALYTKQRNHVIIVTSKQFGKKIGEHAREWGLDKLNSEDRRKLARIIQDILYTDDVRKGTWRGKTD
ncbi:hypothetical protein [Hornefia butyriciproducens]|uniref:Uncharacterized protein n=1 Tax=Hornefia butyriciproducens TaxID=2652293 RepID=A0A6L5Y7C9_9FIRM|nr:hypothetical protein [Hornefia butyriciproducens]MST52600.1 hypothetical protein [Hornefia butyriciproducens]